MFQRYFFFYNLILCACSIRPTNKAIADPTLKRLFVSVYPYGGGFGWNALYLSIGCQKRLLDQIQTALVNTI
jgi:hypothetical protein